MADLQNGSEIYGIALNGMCIIKVWSMMKIITYGILVLLINSIKKSVQEFSMAVAKTFWLSINLHSSSKHINGVVINLQNVYHSKSFGYGGFAN